ncbi:DNA-3-methyladenine glycosylase isoform X2 [Citrus sinensis]|uniref:DNA-3-methyladenine glycosylase isoform X2 n=1 Tax=Citrus sinensis TaxID=2711 RepID=UPI000D62F5A1|nr:DNA-3-methyladenine glycosylase isoform X2 [Citrus sinensis]
MKQTQRFKRVGVAITKTKKPISKTTESTNDDSIIRTGHRPKSVTVKIKSKSSPKPKIAPSVPISAGPSFENMTILPHHFFQIDALDLAPRLLGKFLRRDDVVLQITEVEAYRPNDSACHGRFGITARTAPVFGPGGLAYVYLCYGLHTMLNVVADKEGVGAAVLIRSCAPVSGLKTIQQRRAQLTEKPVLLTGPGKGNSLKLGWYTFLTRLVKHWEFQQNGQTTLFTCLLCNYDGHTRTRCRWFRNLRWSQA